MFQRCVQSIGLPQLYLETDNSPRAKELARMEIQPEAMPDVIFNCARWLLHNGTDEQKIWAEQLVGLRPL